MHADVSHNTYVDFASNTGRYAVGTTNALLDYIRERDNGVRIEYTSGAAAQTLPNGMISFDSVVDMGNATLTNYNYLVTVRHNTTLDPTFGANKYGVGAGNAIQYKGIEEEGTNGSFVLDASAADVDYKLIRLSKLVTDAQSAVLCNPPVINGKTDMSGQLVYRVGGGTHLRMDHEGKSTNVSSGGGFSLGGVGLISHWEDKTALGSEVDYKYAQIKGKESWAENGFSEDTPLPFGSQGGDSGSPYFVWNESTGRFELLLAHTGSFNNGEMPDADAAPQWSQDTMEAYNVHVDMLRTDGTVQIKGIEKADDKGTPITDGIKGNGAAEPTQVSVSPCYGFLYQGNGQTIADSSGNALRYAGVESGTNTWLSLSDLKDTDNWYAYGNDRLNATPSVVLNADKEHVAADGLTYAELFTTQNLVFDAAADNADYTIDVSADTDLGVGYLHFAADKVSNVRFTVKSENGAQVHSAGYVVDAGVQVNVSLRNADAGYMREWRKVGEGTLNICGDGKNEIFLNVGGTGKTLLNQTNGYAAYNVLVNTGATVVINDVEQIYRDLTFGNGGGVLDMNGNSMDWYTTKGEERGKGFTINALTEEAVISNSTGKAVLTYLQEGNTTFAGAFRDTADGALSVVYDAKGTWTLNSIRTSLTHQDSGLTVASGTVKLAGTPTVHGYGSEYTESTADFSTRENDWHYADATMNVTVQEGAVFELESHARLTGTVVVESGGKYIVHEGVQNAMEYIEGGEKLESTADIAAFYGHKGDVKLAQEATLSWQRGSKELASLKGNSVNGGAMEKVESTIGSETQLKLVSAAGETGRISAATLALQTGVRVELCGLYLAADAAVTASGAAAVEMQDSTLELNASNTVLTQGSLETPLTLCECGGAGNTLELAAGTPLQVAESSILSGSLTLSGSSMHVDFSGLAALEPGVVALHFGEEVKFADPGSMRITATALGCEFVGYYAPGNVGCVYFVIPEPATATLSLLALAALAARRRRKQACCVRPSRPCGRIATWHVAISSH